MRLVKKTVQSASSSERERIEMLEAALRRSEKLALAGRLAGSVMHEINNPSQAIADLIFLMAREADQPDMVRTRASQIEEQLGRIQYIARQTLSFFRESPQAVQKDLVPLLETALRYHSESAAGKKIRVQKDLPDTLVADIFPSDFVQLASNLIRNATEALPRNGRLAIRLRACGNVVRLMISDGGPGIAPSIQARLFEAFQSSKAEAGNGLGLWVCKTAVEKHGGRIRWKSATTGARHGTTFMVTLPLKQAQEKPSEKPFVVSR